MTDRPPETASEKVWIMASPEVLAQLEGRWSGPVQVRATRPPTDANGWEMEIRAVSRAGQCGAAGPDGLLCEREPGHGEDGIAGDHGAYADESGTLVRW